jgi:hypothetical protein
VIKLLRKLIRAQDNVALAEARVSAADARLQLLGSVHGAVQTIRGMCSDQLDHEEIDAKLGELDDLVYKVAQTLRHPL